MRDVVLPARLVRSLLADADAVAEALSRFNDAHVEDADDAVTDAEAVADAAAVLVQTLRRALGPADGGLHECDECGAQVPAEPVSPHHLRSCSLHPDNVVDPHTTGHPAQPRPDTTDVRPDQPCTVGEAG